METAGTEAVEVEVQVTREEYARFSRWHFYHPLQFKIVLGASFISTLLLVWFAIQASSNGERIRLLGIASLVPALLIVAWISSRVRIARAYATNEALRATTEFSFSSEGASFEAAWGSGRWAWSLYGSAHESESAFYLYLANTAAQVLPKRCFRSPEEMDRFRQIVRAGMGAKAKL